MPKAICDSSTLIHLSSIGMLDLLPAFYDSLIIPPAVYREVVEEGKGRFGALEIRKAVDEGRVQVQSPKDEALLRLLKRDLEAGEAEVIALAVEDGSADALLDESYARQVAEVFNLRKTGVVGILIRARLENKIPALRPMLERLRDEGGFWFDDKLVEQALKAVGEYPD